MTEIYTILKPIGDCEEFDERVNEALRDGWVLTRRDILPPFEGPTRLWERVLYAELERESTPCPSLLEACCETCKHFGRSDRDEPCRSCEDQNGIPDHWEAVL